MFITQKFCYPCFTLFLRPLQPTNDLDVETIRSLESALLGFGGSALVISHDRWFLNKICTHILAYEGDGMVRFFPGNWQEYDTWRSKPVLSAIMLNFSLSCFFLFFAYYL